MLLITKGKPVGRPSVSQCVSVLSLSLPFLLKLDQKEMARLNINVNGRLVGIRVHNLQKLGSLHFREARNRSRLEGVFFPNGIWNRPDPQRG